MDDIAIIMWTKNQQSNSNKHWKSRSFLARHSRMHLWTKSGWRSNSGVWASSGSLSW